MISRGIAYKYPDLLSRKRLPLFSVFFPRMIQMVDVLRFAQGFAPKKASDAFFRDNRSSVPNHNGCQKEFPIELLAH